MGKFRPKSPLGLFRLMEMGELDIFDALAIAPKIIATRTAQEDMIRYEQRRKAWLDAYRPDLSQCSEDDD